jgi:hypothetical protein
VVESAVEDETTFDFLRRRRRELIAQVSALKGQLGPKEIELAQIDRVLAVIEPPIAASSNYLAQENDDGVAKNFATAPPPFLETPGNLSELAERAKKAFATLSPELVEQLRSAMSTGTMEKMKEMTSIPLEAISAAEKAMGSLAGQIEKLGNAMPMATVEKMREMTSVPLETIAAAKRAVEGFTVIPLETIAAATKAIESLVVQHSVSESKFAHMTIKELVIQAILDHFPEGGRTANIREFIREGYGRDIEAASLRPQMHRLKAEGILFFRPENETWNINPQKRRIYMRYNHPSSRKEMSELQDEPPDQIAQGGVAVFRKVDEDSIGSTPISMAVLEAKDGTIVGRIVTNGIDETFSTFPDDPPIADAISIASRLATTNKVAVNVYDPQNKWQKEWGILH